ncbi:hypothetical protein RM549_01395 [Salegentibacter sp. F188]|uniref:Lipoprotein n=1 Tax=Autumnicola patrickiae TaxID=3075591 RepID=A0ABU3DZC7_9FLAO|nr:hypothetical protein [Salegentibacter sp. F188]MDT0688422.1 hypothetical protein [Salegentibacter sp. F188]
MNKTRIIGAVLLALGICAQFFIESNYAWIFGFAVGLGIALVITGRFRKKAG